MEKTRGKNVNFIFGIILFFLGIVLFAVPLLSSSVVSFLICFAMLLYGLSEIAHYFMNRHDTSPWELFNGIMTTVLSLIFILTPGARLSAIGILIAVWVLFTGTMRVVAAVSSKKDHDLKWLCSFIPGALSALIGIIMLFDPLFGVIVLNHLIAFAILLLGVLAVVISFMIGKQKRTH